MGVCSQSCALSGITLCDEPVVFIPLIRNQDNRAIKGSRIYGEGYCRSAALFSPAALPIYGHLGEYATFDSIQADSNTAIIEKFFGGTIEEFTETCIMGQELAIAHHSTEEPKHLPMAGAFIHPEVYERFSRPVIGGKIAASAWKSTFSGKGELEALGCVYSGKTEDSRYTMRYTHPEIPDVEFWCDGRFTNTYIKSSQEKLQQAYGPDDIHAELLKAGMKSFPIADIKRAIQVSSLQLEYLNEFEEIKADVRQEYLSICGKELDENDGKFSWAPRIRLRLRELKFLRDGMDYRLLEAYLEEFLKGNLLDQVEKLQYLLWSFQLANRVIMPTIVATQHPEHRETFAITNFINEIARKRNQRYSNFD